MSTHSTHTPTLEIESETYESIDDLFSKYIKEVSIFKTFSGSSSDSLKQEAKKLKKSSSLTHKEALNQIALNRGFKSYKDFSNQLKHWESLPSIYIHVSKNTTLSYRKDVFSRLPQDDKSKSMKELMDSSNVNRIKVYESFSEDGKTISENVNETSSVVINANESISEHGKPISELGNHKLGIKLLNQKGKEDFFNKYRDLKPIGVRINKETDFIFKFIHYKIDPIKEKKIRINLEKSSKKHGYKFSEWDVTNKITELIDQQLYALLNTEKYTEDSYVDESYSINPDGYITNHTYYNAVDLHDDSFNEFGPFLDSDY